MNKYLPTAGIAAVVVVAGGLIANTALLNNRVTQLEKYPVKVIVAATAAPTSTPSATPTFYLRKVPVVTQAVK